MGGITWVRAADSPFAEGTLEGAEPAVDAGEGVETSPVALAGGGLTTGPVAVPETGWLTEGAAGDGSAPQATRERSARLREKAATRDLRIMATSTA